MADPTNLSAVTATGAVELFRAPAVLPGHEDAGVLLLRPAAADALHRTTARAA